MQRLRKLIWFLRSLSVDLLVMWWTAWLIFDCCGTSGHLSVCILTRNAWIVWMKRQKYFWRCWLLSHRRNPEASPLISSGLLEAGWKPERKKSVRRVCWAMIRMMMAKWWSLPTKLKLFVPSIWALIRECTRQKLQKSSMRWKSEQSKITRGRVNRSRISCGMKNTAATFWCRKPIR